MEKNIIKINVQAVTHIVIHPKEKQFDWYFQHGKKRRFLPDIKEGFYELDLFGDKKCVTSKEVLDSDKNIYIENNTVFYKPYVVIFLSSNKQLTKFFETKEEATDFVNVNFAGIKLVEI
jgi:hypothetical protein